MPARILTLSPDRWQRAAEAIAADHPTAARLIRAELEKRRDRLDSRHPFPIALPDGRSFAAVASALYPNRR